jgi:16S rRNA (cytidine1402-2'-O)-methyltransferase
MVFYESPLRLVRTLEEFAEYFETSRKCVVARELSKIYEENIRGTLEEVINHFKEKGVKGEIVIVLEGTGK